MDRTLLFAGLRNVLVAAVLATAASATAQVTTANPILFVTQVPVGNFGTATAVFGNHEASVYAAPRGGDLMIRYGDGTLRNLTAEAGYGNDGMQGANSIAVREPCVHFDGTRALFSMIVGAPTQQYQLGTWRWQVYEATGLGVGQVAEVRKIEGQPEAYNNVSPIYATDGRILFASDRPRGGEPWLYPQRDEYESAPIVAGIYGLDEATGELELLEHSPSGSTSLSLDSFGRVVFTKWDHLQRDQQGDAPATASLYQAFTYASEADGAPTTTSLAGAEVFPEPRTMNDPSYDPALSTHSFNHFFPWEMNEDGTAEETLGHIGRQELGGSFTDGSFKADDNLTYFTPDSFHANQLKIVGSAGLFHLREDPTTPGDFLMTYAQEFGTASGGVLLRLNAAPSVNAEQMELTAVTPTSGDAAVPQDTGYFRNPLPTSDGMVVAAHTGATGYAQNVGTTAAPQWNYAFRLKQLLPSGGFLAAGPALTGGIVKSLSWWTPDSLAVWSGELWELDPVEVVARAVPPPRQSVLPAIEASVFADEGVDVEVFRQYLRERELALIVARDVTQRDRSDLQQPFNLAVPGGVQSIGAPGTVYDVTHLQVFQADALRGYGPVASPRPGRRLLARPMHGPWVSVEAGAPEGAVSIASDGSVAALVPARRALSWQLTGPGGEGIVRERNWVAFQSGEIRVCANCHGVNTESQTGEQEPENEPEALRELLVAWKNGETGGGGGEAGCVGGVPLEGAVLRAKAGPYSLKLAGSAVVPEPWQQVDPSVFGLRVVVSGLVDSVVPAGSPWKLGRGGWTWAGDGAGGLARVRVRDLSAKAPGLVSVRAFAKGTQATLPSPAAVKASVAFGSGAECASVAFGGPGSPAPACEGDASRLVCR